MGYGADIFFLILKSWKIKELLVCCLSSYGGEDLNAYIDNCFRTYWPLLRGVRGLIAEVCVVSAYLSLTLQMCEDDEIFQREYNIGPKRIKKGEIGICS